MFVCAQCEGATACLCLDICVTAGMSVQVLHNYKKQDRLFHMVMQLPVAVTAVSEAVQSILSQEFGRAAIIIPNSVDCDRFRPGPLSAHPYTAVLTAPATEVRRSLPYPALCVASMTRLSG